MGISLSFFRPNFCSFVHLYIKGSLNFSYFTVSNLSTFVGELSSKESYFIGNLSIYDCFERFNFTDLFFYQFSVKVKVFKELSAYIGN